MSFTITLQQLEALSPLTRREVQEAIGVFETDIGLAEQGYKPQNLRTPPRPQKRRPEFLEPPGAPMKPKRMVQRMNACLGI